MCAAAAAFVRGRCFFGGAAICSSADDPSGVKSSWGWERRLRYLSKSLPQNKILPEIQIKKQKAPWLMLSSPTKPESRYFYDLLSRGQLQAQDPLLSLNREIDLPQIAGHICVGSSEGFLITIDRNAEIHAINPITGARLSLPSTATLPNMIGVIRDPMTGDIEYYVSSESGTDITQVRPFLFEDRRRKDSRLILDLKPEVQLLDRDFMQFCNYGRAVISPGLDFAAVILLEKGLRGRRLVFGRVGQDSSWTALPSHNESVLDITFRDGRLYTIDKLGTLAIFDLDNPSSPPFLSPEGPLTSNPLRRPRFLVGSPHGDDLFLLVREFDFVYPHQVRRTMTFKVYKLDRSNFKWSRVTSIADYALFVGFNHSVALSARDFPCIKPNSIYFTDCSRKPDLGSYNDAGIFNLEDGSIHPLGDNFNKFSWPPPIWFMPAMF